MCVMASKKKRVILVLILLAFGELIESMGFGKFNKMFPLKDEEKKCFRRPNNGENKDGTDVPQWHHWNDSFYTFVSTTEMTWEDAANACSSMKEGAHLVFIESELENKEVSRLAKVASEGQNNRWWIGLTDIETEGVWKWYNVSLNYAKWYQRQPDNGRNGEDCAELGYRWSGDNIAFWNDYQCTEKKKFICESGFGKDL